DGGGAGFWRRRSLPPTRSPGPTPGAHYRIVRSQRELYQETGPVAVKWASRPLGWWWCATPVQSTTRRFIVQNGASAQLPYSRPTGHNPRSRSQTPPSTEGKKCVITSFKGENYAAAYNQSQCFGRDHQDWPARDPIPPHRR